MVELGLTVELRSPLILHRRRASTQFSPTLDYVPGSTLRGALAALYLRGDSTRAQDPDFQALFLQELVSYPDLLPAANVGEPCHVTPATAWSCKRFGADHADAVTDTLLRLELCTALRAAGRDDWSQPLKDIAACPVCQREHAAEADNCPRDRLQNSYARQLDPGFVKQETNEILRTGTAVDRATGAVASGMLFSQQALEAGQWFTGCLRFDDVQAALLTERIKALLPDSGVLYLGYGRSRGFGQVQVTFHDALAVGATLPERWQALNRTAGRLWRLYKQEPPQSKFFTILAHSHLALQDACGRPVLAALQPSHLGLPWAEWGERELEAMPVPGWNAAWGLPKADTWALKRGSVWLGKVAPEDETQTLARLAQLETAGVGERRAEGFGRVRACDEFHYTYTRREL